MMFALHYTNKLSWILRVQAQWNKFTTVWGYTCRL